MSGNLQSKSWHTQVIHCLYYYYLATLCQCFNSVLKINTATAPGYVFLRHVKAPTVSEEGTDNLPEGPSTRLQNDSDLTPNSG